MGEKPPQEGPRSLCDRRPVGGVAASPVPRHEAACLIQADQGVAERFQTGVGARVGTPFRARLQIATGSKSHAPRCARGVSDTLPLDWWRWLRALRQTGSG